jgi:hypothetical protein
VPFSKSTSRKVSKINIGKNGDIKLSYPDKQPPQTFNLFELYQEEEGTKGIDTIMSGKFIQFYVNENRIRLIRFATAADAAEVYKAFLQLFILCEQDNKRFKDFSFKQTLDFINTLLAKWSESKKQVTITVNKNGNAKITNRDQFFHFNFLDLSPVNINDVHGESGIEIVPCDKKTQAPRAWINFNTNEENLAFIRLDCNTPKAELQSIRDALLHLRTLCTKAGN